MPHPLNCSVARACMDRASDDGLSAPDQARLEAHLALCELCRQEWATQVRLDRAARRWAAPASEDDPGAAFNAQVLARIAALPAARPPLWLPLAVALALGLLLTFLPAAARPDLGWLTASARLLPGWLAANLSGLPGDAVGLLTAGSGHALPAVWIWGILTAAALTNGLFCVRAARSQARRALP